MKNDLKARKGSKLHRPPKLVSGDLIKLLKSPTDERLLTEFGSITKYADERTTTLEGQGIWAGLTAKLQPITVLYEVAHARHYCTSIAETIASPLLGLNSSVIMPAWASTSKRLWYAVSAPPEAAATSRSAMTFCPFARTLKTRLPGWKAGSTNVRTTLCGPAAAGIR